MRGRTFLQLIDSTKAEARHALSPALSQNALPFIKQTIARVYENLYMAHEWPQLQIDRSVNIDAGMRYYAFPPDMDFERTVAVKVKWSGQWTDPLKFGISTDDYNSYDPDQNQRSDPAWKWDWAEGDMIEIWPLPASNQVNALRFEGMLKFVPLVDEADVCKIDSNIVVLFAAAEILASQNSKDAQAKLANAQLALSRLLGKASKNRVTSLVGESKLDGDRERVRVTYARAG